MMDIVERLRVLNFKGPWQEAADEIERLRERDGFIRILDEQIIAKNAEIERLRLLVHYAFCEGQITPFLLEDWINSRSYAALKEGE